MMLKRTLIATSLSLVSLNSLAAAFQLGEHSASGLGRAFAGDAAVAENASVIARNPALMAQFSKAQLSVVATYIEPDVSLEGVSAPAFTTASALNDDSIAPSAFVPAAYYVRPINDKLAFGLGVYSNFGLSTEFNKDYAAGQLAGQTEITTANLNASLSYKINEQFSIGGGISYIYADAKVVRHAGASLQFAAGIPSSTEVANLEGDDFGLGWNVGATYAVSPGHLFGINYRAATDIKFAGHYSNQLPAALPGGLAGNSVPGQLELELPAGAEFSGSHQLNGQLAVHYSVQWTDWSSFDKLVALSGETAVFTKTEEFEDAWRYAIGADYQLNQDVKLRVGIAYDNSPSKKHKSISIPDTNRLWLSTGASYQLDTQSSFDFAVAYLNGEKQTFAEADNIGSYTFESEGNALLISAQYNYQF